MSVADPRRVGRSSLRRGCRSCEGAVPHDGARAVHRAAGHDGAPKAKTANELQPAKFDVNAHASAKLALVDGKVISTAVAQADDPAAAVISNGKETYAVGYVVEAEVEPAAGELEAITVRQVSEARPVN